MIIYFVSVVALLFTLILIQTFCCFAVVTLAQEAPNRNNGTVNENITSEVAKSINASLIRLDERINSTFYNLTSLASSFNGLKQDVTNIGGSIIATQNEIVQSISTVSDKLDEAIKHVTEERSYSFIGLLLGIIAILLVFFMEWIKQPRLRIIMGHPADEPGIRISIVE